MRSVGAAIAVAVCVAAAMAVSGLAAPPLPCRFAPLFTSDALYSDPHAADAFLDAVFYWEGNFHADGVGLNAATGLTYDGHELDYVTGRVTGAPHLFSAPSKESIHVGLLALALNGSRRALTFVLNSDTSADGHEARAWALTLLERKIASYEQFNTQFPGFGCFLPWFAVNDSGMTPTWDWTHTVPSLDNGEMIWALYAVANVLDAQGQGALASRYRKWHQCMTANARDVFFNASAPGFRTVTTIADTSAQPSPSNYAGDTGFLDDPYEGELFTVWLTLFATPQYFSAAEIDAVWAAKRGKLQLATLQTAQGPISTEKGWWFSAHEKWKYLMIPYTASDTNRAVFMTGEKARTWAAVAPPPGPGSYPSPVPGLYASVTGPVPPSGANDLPYYSAVGVVPLAFEEVDYPDVVTPYGSMALWLADRPTALVWYAAMLNATRMQNPYGSTESLNITSYSSGSGGAVVNDICPLTTWDSKITTLLAMEGGLADLNARHMQRDGVMQAFVQRIESEWARVFAGKIVGEQLPFRRPTAFVADRPEQDFTECAPQSNAVWL